MSANPAPLDAGASPDDTVIEQPTAKPVTFQDLWLEAVNERDRHALWRDDYIHKGNHVEAARRQRMFDIYDAMQRLIDRCNDPRVVSILREIAAEKKAEAEADSVGADDE